MKCQLVLRRRQPSCLALSYRFCMLVLSPSLIIAYSRSDSSMNSPSHSFLTFCRLFVIHLIFLLLLSCSLSTLISLPFCFLPFVCPTLFLPSLYRVLSPFPPSFLASLRPGTVYNLLLFPKTPFFFIQLSHLPILVPVDKLVIAPYVESMTLRSWNRMAMYGLGRARKTRASQTER